MVAGIILAAGESRRMGRCKATLPVGPTHLLGLTLEAFTQAELTPIVIVSGKYFVEIERAAAPWVAQVVHNSDWANGQITSLQCALAWCGSSQPALVALVDHPGFSARLCRDMIEVFTREQPAGLVPTYQGQPGHPVLFGLEMVDVLRHLPVELTARNAIEQFGDRVLYFPVNEEAVLRDIDTEDDYRLFLEWWDRERARQD